MTKCSAPNCENSLRRGNQDLTFYEFPEDPDLRRDWLANIGRANWTPGRRSTICSAHFEETQLERKGKHTQLLKGAVPTIFPSAKRKRGSQSHKMSKIKVDIHSPTYRVVRGGTDSAGSSTPLSKISKEPECLTIEIEDVNSLSQGCTNQTLGFGLEMDTEKSMNELILIDGSYILEDCQLIENDSPAQNFHSSTENLRLEETGELTDDMSVEINQELSKSSSRVCENVVIIEPSATDLEQESIIISKNSDVSGKVGRQILYISDIPTPRLYPSLFSIDSENSGVEPPASQFSSEPNLHSKAKQLCCPESEECGEVNTPNILSMSQSILKGTVDLPVHFANHKYRQSSLKRASPELRWQTGTFMCRLCGVTSDKTLNLFSSEAIECRVLERILSLLHIKVVQSDDLPESVCSVCLSKLDTCSELIVTSFNTHQFLASVTSQDVKHSSLLPVHFSVMDREAPRNPAWKRHILLMEMYHEEGRPIEEYLTTACNDLHSRLEAKSNSSKPLCNLLLAPISDNSSVSQVEQARTAAEALISKGLIKYGMQKQFEDLDVCDTFINEDEAHPETTSDNVILKECSPKADLVQPFEQGPSESPVFPTLDDATSNVTGARCLKLTRSWRGKEIVFRNMQRSFFWQEQEDGVIRLVCRTCRKAFESNCNYQSHLENCSAIHETSGATLTDLKSQADSPKTDLELPLKPLSSEDKTILKSLSQKLPSHRYQCSHCSARLQSKVILKQHLSQHHASDSTKCDDCDFETLNVYEAALHRQMCVQVKKAIEWHCRKCLGVFASESKFQEHQANTGHNNEKPSWLCEVCGKRYSVAAKLNEHKKSHLPPEFKYIHQCPRCPKRYINLSRLKEHMQRHEEKKFMCKVCGKLFSTSQILRQHESTHGDPQYLCSLCSRTFFRKSHLLKHMNVHNPLNPRTSRCGPQPHRDGLNRCRECRNVFENNLLEHYKTCHPHVPLHFYVCEICKMENTSYAELFQHQREVHKTGVKDCPFCNKTIDGSTQMKYHLMKHEGMFPYNCPLCSNGYTANSLLQDHMRRKHTGEKPFQCQQCSKSFPTNGALAQHSTVHSLPHQLLPCPVCNQGFKRKAHLDVHLRTHTGEKPYPCPICDRPFRQRPDCVKHVRIIHGEDPSKYKFQFYSHGSVTFPQVVSVAEMELVLEGEDLMQTPLECSNITISQ